jgi:hypothetical protein
VGTNTVNINKCQVKHILILKKTQDPGAKSLEKLQVQKNLTTPTGLQRKTTESLNETKISRKKVQVQNHTQNTQIGMCQIQHHQTLNKYKSQT